MGCIFNYYTNPDVNRFKVFLPDGALTDEDVALIESTRRLWLPIGHGVLCAINFITNNPRLNLDGLKAFASFLGMILMVNLIA